MFAQLDDPVGVLETVLEVCPLLERGLGNILATACGPGEPVPALLRDILAARQLEHVLGTPSVTFLQVPLPILQNGQFSIALFPLLQKLVTKALYSA